MHAYSNQTHSTQGSRSQWRLDTLTYDLLNSAHYTLFQFGSLLQHIYIYISSSIYIYTLTCRTSPWVGDFVNFERSSRKLGIGLREKKKEKTWNKLSYLFPRYKQNNGAQQLSSGSKIPIIYPQRNSFSYKHE